MSLESERLSCEQLQKPSMKKVLSWFVSDLLGRSYINSSNSELYDRIARFYLERNKLGSEIASIYLKYLKGLGSIQDMLICDRASGTGIITEALVDAGFMVRASDISQSQLDLLKERFPQVDIVNEDINGPMVDVADASVYGVVQVAAGKYIDRLGQEMFASEAFRVLQEGGVIIWPVFLTEILQSKLRYGIRHRSFSFSIAKLLEEKGFEIIERNTLIHGRFAFMTCTLLVARKRKKGERKEFEIRAKRGMTWL